MTKLATWVISVVCIVAINTALADEGETIFKSQGCMSRHKKEGTPKVNPSLAEISRAYQGKEEQLIRYLHGDSEAIVRSEKSNLMKCQIEKTKDLSQADLKALVDYFLLQK